MEYTQENFTKMKKALERIADMHLWGEPINDGALRDELVESDEYDLREDYFMPCADTQSTMLTDCVEIARDGLGLPVDRSVA